MSINTSARNYRILIGNEDWTPALSDIPNWQSTGVDSSGLIRTTATLILIETRDNPGSLDDRKNYIFKVGQPVTIDVSNENLTLQRHPAGTLRILSAEYSDETRSLTLQLGCLITLLSYRQPTDPNKAEITPGSFTARNNIVYRLLNAAGITNINCPYSIGFPINYPINIGGSYLSTVGSLLYSAGYYARIDRNEAFAIAPVELEQTPAITLQIGGDQGDELFYRRLSSPESPREVIEVRGVARVASIPEYPRTSFVEAYGDAQTVDPNTTPGTVLVRTEEITENWNEFSGLLETTTNIQESLGLVNPDSESPFGLLYLVPSSDIFERRTFETSTEGKLLSINKRIFRRGDVLFAEFIKAKAEENITFPGISSFYLNEEITTNYTYIKNQVSKIETTKLETRGTVLSGTNEDWTTHASVPSQRVVSETQVETWEKGGVGEWIHSTFGSKSMARLKPELITGETTTAQKLRLFADPSISVRETSNSGQTVPPAAERRPPKAGFEDRQVCGKARFPQHGGNPYKERERTYSIDYLEGKVQTQADIDNQVNQDDNQEEDCRDFQCEHIALIEGKLLIGRSKGQELGTYLSDALLNSWQPLMRVNVVEPDGTIRAFCIDDSHWSLDVDNCFCNFGLIWTNNIVNGAIALPYSIGWNDLNSQRWSEVAWDKV